MTNYWCVHWHGQLWLQLVLKHEQLGQFGLIVPWLCSEFLTVLIKRHCSSSCNKLIMEVSNASISPGVKVYKIGSL